MSKFRPSQATLARVRPRMAATALATTAPKLIPPPQANQPRPVAAATGLITEPGNAIQRIGLLFLCLYLVGNLANDWSQQLLGGRAFLTLITGTLLPVLWLASGSMFRGLEVSVGRWGLALGVWVVLSIPFSIWPGGSTEVVKDFLVKSLLILFYCASLALTMQQCRKLVNWLAAGHCVVVLSCLFFGESPGGRLMIPGSIFFDNSNDLALQLLLGSGFLLFVMLVNQNLALRGLCGLFFLGGIIYILQTSSRANFLSLVCCTLVSFLLVQQRLRLVLVLGFVGLLSVLTMSSHQWNRLVNIVWSPESEDSSNDGDLQSQMARTELFKRSVSITLSHPVFGVGPGEFEDALENVNKGERDASKPRMQTQKTHNSYTQVSSETGIPGLIFYLGLQFAPFLLMIRVFRESRVRRGFEDVKALSMCLILIFTGYTFSTIFQHVVYSRHLPTLAGVSAALWLVWVQMRNQPQPVPLPTR